MHPSLSILEILGCGNTHLSNGKSRRYGNAMPLDPELGRLSLARYRRCVSLCQALRWYQPNRTDLIEKNPCHPLLPSSCASRCTLTTFTPLLRAGRSRASKTRGPTTRLSSSSLDVSLIVVSKALGKVAPIQDGHTLRTFEQVRKKRRTRGSTTICGTSLMTRSW